MDLSKILTITGRPGLYRHIAQSKNSAVVESLEDGKRSSAFISEQLSSLSDIAVFTTGEDIKLEEVFKKIYEKENGKKALKHNAPVEEIKKYFNETVPEYDKERVYVSDLKKILKWYGILIDANILEFSAESEEDKEDKKDTDTENQ